MRVQQQWQTFFICPGRNHKTTCQAEVDGDGRYSIFRLSTWSSGLVKQWIFWNHTDQHISCCCFSFFFCQKWLNSASHVMPCSHGEQIINHPIQFQNQTAMISQIYVCLLAVVCANNKIFFISHHAPLTENHKNSKHAHLSISIWVCDCVCVCVCFVYLYVEA